MKIMAKMTVDDLEYACDAFTFDEYEKAFWRNMDILDHGRHLHAMFRNATPKERKKITSELKALWEEQPLLEKILSATYYCPNCEDTIDMRYYHVYNRRCPCCGKMLERYDGIGGFYDDDRDQPNKDAMTA